MNFRNSVIKIFDKIFDKLYTRYQMSKENELRKKLKFIGKNVVFGKNIRIINPEFVSIGDETHIDDNVLIIAYNNNLLAEIKYRRLKIPNNLNETLDQYKLSLGEIRIGKNCHIGINSMIFGYGGVSIGDYFTTSPDVKIYSLNSLSYDPVENGKISYLQPYNGESPTEVGPVILGENGWLGIGAIILPNTILEKNCFVSAYSYYSGHLIENTRFSRRGIPEFSKRFDNDRKNNK